ncbi:cytochrome P450 [Aphanothece sacrum]|uniref:Cytochrome P450 n=1 Tax=Aphanothece sacrum FPU1 TaxID=1920663 RepID=A0A401IDX9_APHSA|nr:cytochrome P450 [Aphanothece sacrum]GBF79473.1 cytochrome P450 [Aphanothece sacrum FPU1]GBF85821.1 cytochrome P450 [Aphanothece sacrum FPU3]
MLKGLKIALQADTGKWFSRCNNCQQTVNNVSDTITVHIDSPVANHPYAHFDVIDVGGGKIALKADTGKYVARCNGCIVNGAYPDFVTVHIDDPSLPYAQFTPERLANGKYALKADTGKYVSRCNGCSPTSAYPDTVTIHVDDPNNAPWAQWTVSYIPFSYLERYDRIPAENVADKVAVVNQGVWTDWTGLFKELRANRPIFITPKFTLVSLFPDVQEVLSRSEVFTVRTFAPKMDPVFGPCMLARDNSEYNWRDKSVLRTMLQLEDLPRVRKMAGEIAKSALDKATPTSKIEVLQDLAKFVPIRLCGDYFGFPGPDLATMYRWSKATQDDMFRNLTNDPKIHEASVQAGNEMRAYLTELLKQKKAQSVNTNAPADVFTRFATTKFASDISFDENKIISHMIILLVGSIEGTGQVITQAIEQLLKRPEVFQKALAAAKANDDTTFDKYVWESIRFNPFSPFLVRFCEADYTLAAGTPRETRIPAKSVVLAGVGSAMFDPGVVKNPDQFSIDRPKYHYMHFGYGSHTCGGEHIAGVVVPEVVKQIMLRPGIRFLPGDEGKVQYQGYIPTRFVVGYDK